MKNLNRTTLITHCRASFWHREKNKMNLVLNRIEKNSHKTTFINRQLMSYFLSIFLLADTKAKNCYSDIYVI